METQKKAKMIPSLSQAQKYEQAFTGSSLCSLFSLLVHLFILLSIPAPGQTLQPKILYEIKNERYGWQVASVGDIDQDGYGDFIAGAGQGPDYWDPERGDWHYGPLPWEDGPEYARLYSGIDGKEIYTISNDNSWRGQPGGDGVFNPMCGNYDKAALGDVNGDQVPDFLLHYSREYNGGYAHEVALFSGRDGNKLRHYTGHPLKPGQNPERLQWSRVLSDLNQDGVAEYVVLFNTAESWFRRKASIYDGLSGEVLMALNWDSSLTPMSLMPAEDLNEDGIPEIAVALNPSSPRSVLPSDFPPDSWEIWFVSGALRGEFTSSEIPEAAIVDKFVFEEGTGLFNPAIWEAPDLDGDGKSDWLAIIRGKPKPAISSSTGNVLWTRSPLGLNGWARGIAFPGDVNNDGVTDIVSRAGNRLSVFSGRTGTPLYESDPFPDELPVTRGVSAFGDLDGDGISEIAYTRQTSIFIVSFGAGEKVDLYRNYEPNLNLVEQGDEHYVTWPALVDPITVEHSSDLQDWRRLFIKLPTENRAKIAAPSGPGGMYFRLKYEPTALQD